MTIILAECKFCNLLHFFIAWFPIHLNSLNNLLKYLRREYDTNFNVNTYNENEKYGNIPEILAALALSHRFDFSEKILQNFCCRWLDYFHQRGAKLTKGYVYLLRYFFQLFYLLSYKIHFKTLLLLCCLKSS